MPDPIGYRSAGALIGPGLPVPPSDPGALPGPPRLALVTPARLMRWAAAFAARLLGRRAGTGPRGAMRLLIVEPPLDEWCGVAERRLKHVGFVEVGCFVSCPEGQDGHRCCLASGHTSRSVLDDKAVSWTTSQ